MIYEWYSGSDASNTVPKGLNKLNDRGGSWTCDERNASLRELLGREQEQNWRAYLLWRIGRNYLDDDRCDPGVSALLQAKETFDPLLETFHDVKSAYCDTLYHLVLEHYYDRKDYETIADFTTSITANLGQTEFNDFATAMIFFYQGVAFEMLAKKHSVDFLRPLALASYLRWHHIAPENEAGLEHLAYAYFRAGDMAHSRSAVETCLEVAPAGEVRDRIEEFAREHAREIDPLNGTS